MRITVTLDPDVEQLLRAAMREREAQFKTVLNDAPRHGLAPRRATARQRYRQLTFDLGRPLVDLAKANIRSASHVSTFADPMDACRGADLVTTDVWTSMGFEAENEVRKKAFADWCVDADMMRVASRDALFMHCLPAHRGEEVTAEVIDGSQSVVWDEAENRLHVQKALMEFLLLGKVSN